VFRYITVTFLADVTRQTVRNLWHDGSLFKWSTWKSGARLLFARDGMIRGNVGLVARIPCPRFSPQPT
jgi:predicted metal-dependent hydrolase